MKKQILILVILMFAATASRAQSGGIFTVTQSVVATGGGQNFSGGAFAVDGTIGQTLAGTNSGGVNFSVQGGFWQPALAPTAAQVSVSGRVMTPGGNGLVNAIVTLISSTGEARNVRTSTFGYFRFENVAVGETYIVSITSKRFQFSPRVVTIFEEIADLDFVATE